MSQNLNFHLKINEKLLPIASFSQNSLIFQTESGIPYEKIKVITKIDMKTWKEKIDEKIKDFENSLSVYRERIERILRMNNSVDEKEALIEEYEEYIRELNEEIEEAKREENFFEFLEDMVDELNWYKKYNLGASSPCEEAGLIYAGIDSGLNPEIT